MTKQHEEDLIARLLSYLQPSLEGPESARSLLRFHHSLRAVLEGDPAAMHSLTGLYLPAGRFLNALPHLARYMLNEQLDGDIYLASFQQAARFLVPRFAGLRQERLYVLCLDEDGYLLDCRCIQEGSLSEAAFYTRAILRRVLIHEARAVVLCHNHPGASPHFSRDDVRCTLAVSKLLSPLGVALVDHILISGGKAHSIRDCRELPADAFSQLKPQGPLLAGWLQSQEDMP